MEGIQRTKATTDSIAAFSSAVLGGRPRLRFFGTEFLGCSKSESLVEASSCWQPPSQPRQYHHHIELSSLAVSSSHLPAKQLPCPRWYLNPRNLPPSQAAIHDFCACRYVCLGYILTAVVRTFLSATIHLTRHHDVRVSEK